MLEKANAFNKAVRRDSVTYNVAGRFKYRESDVTGNNWLNPRLNPLRTYLMIIQSGALFEYININIPINSQMKSTFTYHYHKL
jgi:hypothetical protein